MKVGEKYKVFPECQLPDSKVKRHKVKGKNVDIKIPMTGTIVWVHPKLRFAVLEFEGIHGNPRECFWPWELTETNRVYNKRRNKQ